MTILDSIMLGTVEGITEFLPISSTGHLVLASSLLNLKQTEFLKSFEIAIQFGAILSVVFLYWRSFFKTPDVWKKVLTAFIPTAIVGFFLYKTVKTVLLGNPFITVWALLIGGIVMIGIELFHKEKGHAIEKIENISYRSAFIIGVCQAISIVPGVSRAAATILGALFVGTKRKTAVEFSFLLAFPTMAAATGLDLLKTRLSFSSSDLLMLSVGFCVSFFVALFSMKWFLQFIQKHSFIGFGVYRILVALIFWLFILR